MKTIMTQVRLTLVLLILCSCAFPAFIWALGMTAFPNQAEGSLERRSDGTVVGSRLLGQQFSSPQYFHGRPSAVGYNTAGSGGSNYSATNPSMLRRISDAVTSASQLDGLTTSAITGDRIFASGSGLDPDVTPENARQQIARVARERGLPRATLEALVEQEARHPVLGPGRVNVLELNSKLDALMVDTACSAKR